MKQKLLVSIVFIFLLPTLSFAEGAESFSKGDTAWVLVATALVMLMTPAGLALFYGGLTRSKSVLNTIGMSYIAFCITSVVWAIVGYSIAFEEGNGIIGTVDNFLLLNINISENMGSIPMLLFVAFQGTFAAIAVAIVSGSIIERVKFSTWIVFVTFWVILVYCPVAHWIWGGGFLSHNGVLDFAGGTVIHINAGVAGLIVAYMLGKRNDYSQQLIQPSSIKLTVLGSALLWFGWFGFNAGSQLKADHIAANALLVTNIAASIGGISWLFIEWIDMKKPTLIGVASGVISGLVGITPAAGYVDVTGALCIGLLSGVIGYLGVIKLKKIIGYDDSLDVFGIHGLVGISSAILTGIFANPEINNASGLLYGNPSQVLIQLKPLGVTIAYSAIVTYIVFKISSFLTGGARVHKTIEVAGLDEMIHGEKGFNIDESIVKEHIINN